MREAKPLSNGRSTYTALGVLALALAGAASPLPHGARDALALAALAAAAVLAWQPRAAVAFLLFYLPLRVLVEAITPVPVRFLADVAVLALVARVLWLYPDDILPLDPVEWLALLFGAWGLAATVHAHQHLGGAVLEARDLLLFVLLYAAVRRLRRHQDGLDAAWWRSVSPFALASVAIVGVQAMLQTFVLGHPLLLPASLLGQLHVSGVNAGRPYGWLDNPNVFGELGFFALVMTYDLARAGALRPRWLAVPAAAFYAAMVVLSFSRSAYLITAVAAVMFAYGRRARWERTGIAATVVAMAVAVALIPGARERTVAAGTRIAVAAAPHHPPSARAGHGGTRKPQGHGGPRPGARGRTAGRPTAILTAAYFHQSLRAGRLHNLLVGLHLIRHHPFGTGLGTFGSAGAKAFHHNLPGLPRSFYADNQYLVVLVETGVPGTLLFALLAVAVFAAILRARTDPFDRRFVLTLFVATAILGATENAWEELVLTIYPWLALSVLIADRGQVRSRTQPRVAAPAAVSGRS